MDDSNLQALIQNFIEASLKLEEASLSGDVIKINYEGKQIKAITGEIRCLGKEAMELMISLLNHQNNYVKCYAACCIIPVYPEKAREALNEIAQLKGLKDGLIGFNAKMTLREWDSGNLSF